MKQVLVTIALVLGVVLAVWKRAGGASVTVHTEPAASAAESSAPPGKVVISMLYSPEKEGWITWAQDQYVHKNPNVQIKLTSMTSVLAIDAILNGKEKPIVWSPESMLEMADVAERWKKQTGHPLYINDAAHTPESLLRTALVFIAWQSRANVLEEYVRKNDGKHAKLWKRLIEATVSQEGWKGFDGPAAWGPVKFGFTDPLQTGVGLWTMYLACLDELDEPQKMSLENLDDTGVASLLRAATSARPLPTMASDLVKRMEQFGPNQYDVVVTYENLALEAIKMPKERWERLVIYYPPKLIWSDHPAAVLELDGISNDQRKAGQQWIQFLKTEEVQRRAISYGFRPANDAIPLASELPNNPFVAVSMRTRDRLKLENVVAPPDGAVVDKLLQTLRTDADQL